MIISKLLNAGPRPKMGLIGVDFLPPTTSTGDWVVLEKLNGSWKSITEAVQKVNDIENYIIYIESRDELGEPITVRRDGEFALFYTGDNYFYKYHFPDLRITQ